MEDTDIRTPVPTIYGDHAKKFHEVWTSQIEHLKKKFASAIEEVWMPGDRAVDVPVIFVKKESVIEVLSTLKNELKYQFLSDLTCTDETPNEKRFEVVYQLLSHERFCRIRVKTRAREGEEVPTAISLWTGANWAEREVYDMFGLKFSGHPDMRRIIMDVRWQGHPLRKDYPLRGYQVFPTPEPIDMDVLEKQ